MLQALAIVLMINGVQIELPAPAYLVGDYAYMPARAVFEYLGYEVRWDAASQKLQVRSDPATGYWFTVGKKEIRQNSPGSAVVHAYGTLPVAPRIISGYLYVPIQAVVAITGAEAKWDAESRTVSLTTTPAGQPAPVNLGRIISNPPAWAGQVVEVKGEYLGWSGGAFGPATSQGPPVTRSDWILRDATSTIYCARAPQRESSGETLSPLSDRGRRLQVRGVVALADGGFPYLQVIERSPLKGLEAVTCYLTTDRLSYQRGDTIAIQMKVENPNLEPVILRFTSGKTCDFAVADVEGNVIWHWSQGKAFTMALMRREFKPGEEYTITEKWTVPSDLRPGLYQVQGEINREVQSYPVTIQVVEGE